MKKTILAASFFLMAAFANAQENKTQTQTPGTVTPAAPENKNAPEMKFEIETFDFGTIKQGDKVTHDFEFLNSGKEPLIITEAHGSCGCTVPQWPKEPVGKGSKGTIHVEFNSTGKMGMQDKTVTITSNAKSGQKVLHLKGNVEAPATTPATETPAPEKK
jgi:hypothetical protein